MIYAGKEITAAQLGQQYKKVCCDQCGTNYFYELTRIGVGKGSAVLGIGRTSATARATDSAERALAERLDAEAEMVPCPECHWVNDALVQGYRRGRYPLPWKVIGVAMFVGLTLGPIITSALTEVLGYQSRLPAMIGMPISFLALLTPLWAIIFQQYLRRRINPNATFPDTPFVPVGTPPAMFETVDATTGQAGWFKVPSGGDAPAGQETWAIFRPGQIHFPPVCCICLSPATTVYRPVMAVNDNPTYKLPVCAACDASTRWRWWRTLLLVAAITAFLGGTLAAVVPGIDEVGRWALFGMLVFFGGLIGGAATASIKGRPYRYKVIDENRGIVKFAARHPAFTAMLIEQVRQSDGLA